MNRNVGQILRFMIIQNIREWEEILPHIEFEYNWEVHSTTSLNSLRYFSPPQSLGMDLPRWGNQS